MIHENVSSPHDPLEEETVSPATPAKHAEKSRDELPPMIAPARGPMDQITPDVPTGSTPLTRHDD
jgi:hypothetical protein